MSDPVASEIPSTFHALSAGALSELIGAIYDCALDPWRWRKLLADLRTKLDFESASLSVLSLPACDALLDIETSTYPTWIEGRSNSIGVMEIWGLAANSRSYPLGEPLLFSRLQDRPGRKSRLYRMFGGKMGKHDILAFGLARDSATIGSISFIRDSSAGGIGDSEIAAIRLLVPHLQRALAINGLLDVGNSVVSTFKTALDALRCGVLLIDVNGFILHANHSAERMLRGGSTIRSVHGFLQARVPSAAKELRAAIPLATRNEARVGKGEFVIRLTDLDQPPILAHVLSMTGGERRTGLQSEAIAAVFIGASPDDNDTAAALAAAFGLTPAETRVLASLVAGRTLEQTASTLRVAVTTTKTHLENIFSKTGVARQADLVLTATRAVPATTTPA